MSMKIYKAKVSATVEMTVTIKEYDNGEMEIEEIDEVTDVDEFENVRPL
jgi:hypothetical protein